MNYSRLYQRFVRLSERGNEVLETASEIYDRDYCQVIAVGVDEVQARRWFTSTQELLRNTLAGTAYEEQFEAQSECIKFRDHFASALGILEEAFEYWKEKNDDYGSSGLLGVWAAEAAKDEELPNQIEKLVSELRAVANESGSYLDVDQAKEIKVVADKIESNSKGHPADVFAWVEAAITTIAMTIDATACDGIPVVTSLTLLLNTAYKTREHLQRIFTKAFNKFEELALSRNLSEAERQRLRDVARTAIEEARKPPAQNQSLPKSEGGG